MVVQLWQGIHEPPWRIHIDISGAGDPCTRWKDPCRLCHNVGGVDTERIHADG